MCGQKKSYKCRTTDLYIEMYAELVETAELNLSKVYAFDAQGLNVSPTPKPVTRTVTDSFAASLGGCLEAYAAGAI